jgi:hypothetical protein
MSAYLGQLVQVLLSGVTAGYWKEPGINITVGHRPLAEQNADMAVY